MPGSLYPVDVHQSLQKLGSDGHHATVGVTLDVLLQLVPHSFIWLKRAAQLLSILAAVFVSCIAHLMTLDVRSAPWRIAQYSNGVKLTWSSTADLRAQSHPYQVHNIVAGKHVGLS